MYRPWSFHMCISLRRNSPCIAGLQLISRDTDNNAAMYNYWWTNKRSQWKIICYCPPTWRLWRNVKTTYFMSSYMKRRFARQKWKNLKTQASNSSKRNIARLLLKKNNNNEKKNICSEFIRNKSASTLEFEMPPKRNAFKLLHYYNWQNYNIFSKIMLPFILIVIYISVNYKLSQTIDLDYEPKKNFL